MPQTTIRELVNLENKSLKDLDTFYLAVGEELFFVDLFVSILRELAFKSGVEVKTYTAGVEKTEFKDFITTAYSNSLFSESKIIIIRGGESLNSEDLSLLIHTVQESSKVVTFMHLLKEDKRKKVFKDLRKIATTFDVKVVDARQSSFWLKYLASKKGFNFSPDMFAVLSAKLGDNLQIINNELDKLKNYVEDKELTADLLKDFIKNTSSVGVFDFLEAFFGKKTKLAYKYLLSLEEAGESSIMLLSLMINRLSKLLIVKSTRSGESVRMNPYYLRKLQSEAKLYSYGELRELYIKLISIDAKLKSSNLDFALLYKLLMV